MCDAAEVAERRKPGVRRRESLLDVLLLRFSKMRRDFLIQIAIDVTRMQKCIHTAQKSRHAAHDRSSEILKNRSTMPTTRRHSSSSAWRSEEHTSELQSPM